MYEMGQLKDSLKNPKKLTA